MGKKKYIRGERRLWNVVKRCLEKKPYSYVCRNPYFSWLRNGFLNKGIERIRADVIGFKEIGGYHRTKIEVIAVEVKDWQWKYTKANIDQARRASIFAHKCYLAAPRKFKPDEIQSAVEKGVGLFEIKNRKKLIDVLPAPSLNPDEHNVMRLLTGFRFFRCSICDCLINEGLLKSGSGFYVYDEFTKEKYKWKWQIICPTCVKRIPKKLDVVKKKEIDEVWDEIDRIKEQIKRIRNLRS
jgi:polyhydroxyalkanoate synthesis regulator phasin